MEEQNQKALEAQANQFCVLNDACLHADKISAELRSLNAESIHEGIFNAFEIKKEALLDFEKKKREMLPKPNQRKMLMELCNKNDAEIKIFDQCKKDYTDAVNKLKNVISILKAK